MAEPGGRTQPGAAALYVIGLCPLLALSQTLLGALVAGLVMLAAVTACAAVLAGLRRHAGETIRLPLALLGSGTAVVCAELLLQAFAWPFARGMGVYLPLIACSSVALVHARISEEHGIARSLHAAATGGVAYLGALLALGALRELLGAGTLLAGADSLFGARAAGWEIALFAGHAPLPLAALAPGAFLCAGLLAALWRVLRRPAPPPRAAEAAATPARRIRISGTRP